MTFHGYLVNRMKLDTFDALPLRVDDRPAAKKNRLAWLAGIIDGEGNLQATVQEKKCGSDGTRRKYFEPKVRITNTDVRMIKRVSEIYVEHGIVFFYAINDVKRYKNRKSTWRNQLEITVASKVDIAKLLHLVLPYLVAKRQYAVLFLDTISWVSAQPRRGRFSKGRNYTEAPEFWEHIVAMAHERDALVEPKHTKRTASAVLKW